MNSQCCTPLSVASLSAQLFLKMALEIHPSIHRFWLDAAAHVDLTERASNLKIEKRELFFAKKIEVDDVHIFLTHKTIYLLSSATWLDELMPISPMLWVHKFYFASGKFLNGGASLYGRLTWHDVRLFIKKARFIDRLVMRWKKFNDWQNFYIDPHHPIKIWNYSKWHRYFCTK